MTVAAGDLIGASPLLSAAFHDEPTIEAMNKMGLQITSVGNHEFDEGWRELVRMQKGGCLDDGAGKDNQNSCADHTFTGAKFRYLSANVFHEDTGKTVFPGVTVKKYGGVKVGFIGMTLENTPNIVTKSGVAGLRFTDEVETANAAAKKLQRQGVKSIVVLVHEGGFPSDPTAYNSCPGISGPDPGHQQGPQPPHRRGDHRPHAPGVQLPAQGPQRRQPSGHQRVEPGSADHRHRPEHRQAHR